jgi:hypothetical protein
VQARSAGRTVHVKSEPTGDVVESFRDGGAQKKGRDLKIAPFFRTKCFSSLAKTAMQDDYFAEVAFCGR